jgi:DNA-binding PadR family transcriptional regulator
MHPYEISTTLRTRGKEQSIKLNYGSLYSVVESLGKHGLVRAKETVRDGRRPERTVYEITEAGQNEMEDWLAELLSTPARDYTSLEAGLSLMAMLPPDEVARLLAERAERLRIDLRSMDATLAAVADMGLPDVFTVETSFRRAMMAAELDFVAGLVGDIRLGKLGGTAGWRRMHELRAEGVTFEQVLADPVGHLGEEGRALLPTTDNK